MFAYNKVKIDEIQEKEFPKGLEKIKYLELSFTDKENKSTGYITLDMALKDIGMTYVGKEAVIKILFGKSQNGKYYKVVDIQDK
jgi:hypothetical protein